MAEETLTYNLEADASKMIASVSAAADAVIALTAAVQKTVNANTSLAASADQVASAQKKAADEAKAAAKAQKEITDAANKSSKAWGEFLEKIGATTKVKQINEIKEQYDNLSPAMKKAAVAATGLTAAKQAAAGAFAAASAAASVVMTVVAAAATAVAAYTLAVGGAAMAIVSLAASSSDAAKETAHLANVVPIDKDKLKSADQMNLAMQTLADLAKRVGADIGSQFAPALRDVAVDMLSLGLMAADAWNTIIKGAEETVKGFNLMVNLAINPARTAWNAFVVGAVNGTEMLLGLVGKELPDSLARLRDANAAQAVSTNVVTEAFGTLQVATASRREQSELLLAGLEAQAIAEKANTQAIRKGEEAERDRAKANRDSAAAAREQAAEQAKLQSKAQKAAEDRAKKEMASMDAIRTEHGKLVRSKLSDIDKEIYDLEALISTLEKHQAVLDQNSAEYAEAQAIIDEFDAKLIALKLSTVDVGEASQEAAETTKSAWSKFWTSMYEESGMTADEIASMWGNAVADVAEAASQMVFDYLDKLEERREADAAAREERIAGLQEERDAALAAYREEEKAYAAAQSKMTDTERAKAQATLEIKRNALQASKDALDEEQKEARKNAMADWRRHKGVAIAKAINEQGLIALRTIAQFGPPVPPNVVGIAAMGTAATIGALSLGQVLASKPPKFHRGAGPDEINATLQHNEAVLSPVGVATAGGNAAIEALNRGVAAAQSGANQTAIYLNDRLVDMIGSTIMDRQSPALRMATGAARPGSRTGY